jgi:hypothetical protein
MIEGSRSIHGPLQGRGMISAFKLPHSFACEGGNNDIFHGDQKTNKICIVFGELDENSFVFYPVIHKPEL